MNELQQQEFDYSLVDTATVTKLEEYEKQLNRIYNSYSVEVGEVLYHAQQDLSNYGDGTFIKWAESKGIKERSLYHYINAYKFLQQLQKSISYQNLEGIIIYLSLSNSWTISHFCLCQTLHILI